MRTTPCLVLFLLITAFAATAHAQVSDERMADYRAMAEEGVTAFNEGNLALARQHFERAASILPNPRVYRLLGRVALAEQSYVEAAQLFHRALSAEDAGHPLSDTLRREVETELLPNARRHVAEYRLDVSPAEASVTVDGAAAVIVNGALILEPGSHTLVAEASGHPRLERTVQAGAGTQETLTLHLGAEGEPSATDGANTRVDQPARASGTDLSPAGIGLIAGGAAVAVLGGVFIGVGWSDADAVDNTAEPFLRDQSDRAQWMIPTGYVLAGVGLAAAVVGVVVLVIGDGGDTQVSLSPDGLRVRGTF